MALTIGWELRVCVCVCVWDCVAEPADVSPDPSQKGEKGGGKSLLSDGKKPEVDLNVVSFLLLLHARPMLGTLQRYYHVLQQDASSTMYVQ